MAARPGEACPPNLRTGELTILRVKVQSISVDDRLWIKDEKVLLSGYLLFPSSFPFCYFLSLSFSVSLS